MMDFGEIWPTCWSDILQKDVRLLRNSRHFYRDGLARDTHMKIFYWPTLQLLFSGTNRNIEKASQPFVCLLYHD